MNLTKHEILKSCITIVNEKIEIAERELSRLNQSQNSETKSSMGDKYETSREMMQRERDNLLENLSNSKSQLSLLQRLDPDLVHTQVQLGSFVETDKDKYFIGVGLGKIITLGITIFAVSLQSPIGKLLSGKKLADTFGFNGVLHHIKNIT